MAASIAHRGPDGEGLFIDHGELSVGLASRRLAVIDVHGGSQPMTACDGRFTIVYNGELFNASEVRRELEVRGHRFRTHCDTEVVLRGFAEWREHVLERLNGMWAFAIWDRVSRRLFLARDRLGVKPLVYAQAGESLVFGSEVKALLRSGLVGRTLALEVLPYYLSFFAIPDPYSAVAGVRRLPAGHFLYADRTGVSLRQYWDCSLREDDKDRGRGAYTAETAELLEDSVRRRLVSDVPLGVFLSGGVDSQLVGAYAGRHLDEPVRTFTLGFDEPDADERDAARVAARALGSRHVEEVLGRAEMVEALPGLLEAYDEPGQSLVQTHFVSRLARRDVTVALSGLGGDELYGSYPAHVVTAMLARLERLPEAGRELLAALGRAAPHPRLRSLARLAAMPSDERAARRLMHQSTLVERDRLLAADARAAMDTDAPARHLEGHFQRAAAASPLNRVLYVYVKTYLADELLRATDAMSMHNSLEVRTPFLDYRLVEHAMRVPARHKMSWRTGKLVLRDVAAGVLPSGAKGPKRGFSLPLGSWFRGELRENLLDLLAPEAVERRGVFDPVEVRRLLDRVIDAGDPRAVPSLAAVYSFEVWARRWLDGETAPEPTPATVGPGA